jgi:hypothetical protein
VSLNSIIIILLASYKQTHNHPTVSEQAETTTSMKTTKQRRRQLYGVILLAALVLFLVVTLATETIPFLLVMGTVVDRRINIQTSTNATTTTTTPPRFKTNNDTTTRLIDEVVEEVLLQEEEIPPFWPNHMMEQYKRWHSVTTLHQTEDRKYAIVYYYCPKRAGNILHSMFITVAWAMITNRTILFKYDTDFSDPNTEQECNAVLERAAWIPRWDDWADVLNLPEPVPIAIDRYRWHYDQQHTVVIFPQIPDIMSKHKQIFRHEWRHDPFDKKEFKHYIQDMGEQVRERAAMLYYYGTDFLFGTRYLLC